MASPRYVTVTTTVGGKTRADSLAKAIVAARLAACVQRLPIRSVYWWRGRMESSAEHLLTAKTRAGLAARLVRFIRAQHPYELPEIVVTPISGGLPGYLAWIAAETRAARPRPSGLTFAPSGTRNIRPRKGRIAK